MARESLGTVVKRRLMGLGFIVVIAGLISLSIAIYNKAFTTTVDVTLKMDHTGNQLEKYSDVKERGIIVGSVDSVTDDGDVAEVHLKLDPGRVKQIPSNVSAQILPKTLFGEQYVSLIIPSKPARAIQGGDTISQDRSKGALEAQTVFAHLYPLLTAVQPAQLNATLTAIATALKGRGNELGETLVNLDDYLKTLNSTSSTGNTYTAQLADDLGKLGQVATEYNGVAPDLFDSLDNLLTSARTVIQKQQALDQLLTAGNGAAGVLASFLSDNEQRIIAVSGQTEKVFGLLDQYSSEYTCVFETMDKLYGEASKSVYNGAIHLKITTDASNPGAYKPGESPKLIEGYGPHCFGLPDNPTPTDSKGNFLIPAEFCNLNDGADLVPAEDRSTFCEGGGKTTSSTRSTSSTATTKSATLPNTSSVQSPEENAMVNTLISGQLGTTPDKVPGAATLLAGPLLRGQQVVAG
jgi:phospholipid/cholesterol/gamma-HCH transport system substrate-binding protein